MDVTTLVFRGAVHTRFSHSLGVSHLATKLIEHLAKQKDLEVTASEVTCVSLAGLCHDLGHGPFSHLFDSRFMPLARPELNYSHEKMSVVLFKDLVDSLKADLPSLMTRPKLESMELSAMKFP